MDQEKTGFTSNNGGQFRMSFLKNLKMEVLEFMENY